MVNPMYAKILSEGLLSFYPSLVKLIDLPLNIQLWTRLLIYSLISVLYIDRKIVGELLFSKSGILLAGTNLVHIYTSYKGFQLLPSGISYSIFYIYPILILLLSGSGLNLSSILAFLGVLVISTGLKNNNQEKSEETFMGIFYILLAAITEALLYFIVKKIETPNSWNHVFLSYFLGMIVISLTNVEDIKKSINLNSKKVSIILLANGIIGALGYYLRFYSVSRISPILYSVLSYFGIIMSYIYGYFVNREGINDREIFGTIMIIISNLMILRK